MRVVSNKGKKIELLAFPYPYKAWLALSNDPDNTVLADWSELDRVIWKELDLPFGDTLFIRSFNHNLKNQVNLYDNPEIGKAHPVDSIHTWGDYVHSRNKNFDRSDAIENIAILKEHDINPKVWIDHSSFEGNLLHRSDLGSVPSTQDEAGHSYENYKYTLDLIQDLGIRYIWDGNLTQYIGQDLALSPAEYYNFFSASTLKAKLKSMVSALPGALVKLLKFKFLQDYKKFNNSQYQPHIFPDKSKLYTFKRFGTWKDADIDGLGEVINPQMVDTLIDRMGTCIVYTHLGKRKENRTDDKRHIPDKTHQALQYIKGRYDQGALNVSPVSELLDYLVLRDHITIDQKTSTIEIKVGDIANKELSVSSLAGFSFSLDLNPSVDVNSLHVKTASGELPFSITPNEGNIYTLTVS